MAIFVKGLSTDATSSSSRSRPKSISPPPSTSVALRQGNGRPPWLSSLRYVGRAHKFKFLKKNKKNNKRKRKRTRRKWWEQRTEQAGDWGEEFAEDFARASSISFPPVWIQRSLRFEFARDTHPFQHIHELSRDYHYYLLGLGLASACVARTTRRVDRIGEVIATCCLGSGAAGLQMQAERQSCLTCQTSSPCKNASAVLLIIVQCL